METSGTILLRSQYVTVNQAIVSIKTAWYTTYLFAIIYYLLCPAQCLSETFSFRKSIVYNAVIYLSANLRTQLESGLSTTYLFDTRKSHIININRF